MAPAACSWRPFTLRLLVLAPHLRPDTAPTGELVSAIVDSLTVQGHSVHVVTSLPWYQEHRVVEGWRGRLVRRGQHGDATVTRVYPFPTDKTNLFARALGFLGLTGLAMAAGLTARGPFDGVLAVSPPLTFGLTGWLLARRHRCPLVFNVQDVFPDVAIEVGALRSARAIALFRWLERATYRRATAVTVLSAELAANVRSKVASPQKPEIRVIPNFVDVDFIQPMSRKTDYRKEHGLGDRTVIMYAGNLGHSQSFNLVIEAARLHWDRKDLVYVINGGGVRFDDLVAAARELPNMVVVGYQPAERVPEVLATADIHLVPLRAGLSASSVPSKTYSILAAGRPVVAAIDEASEVAREVLNAEAGLAVAPDDVDGFIAAIELLADDPQLCQAMGRNGREWAEAWCSSDWVARTYADLVEELGSHRG